MSAEPDRAPPVTQTVLTAAPPRSPGNGWFLGIAAAEGLALIGILTIPLLRGEPVDAPTATLALVLALTVIGTLGLPRLTRRAPRPDRLSIGPDRIELIFTRGAGRAWRRADSGLVRLNGSGRSARLLIGAGAIGISAGQLRCFDPAEIRAACVVHGWSWQEGSGPVLDPVMATDRGTPEIGAEVLIRDGNDALPDRVKFIAVTVFAIWPVAILTVITISIVEGSFAAPLWLLPVSAPAALVASAGYAATEARRLKITVTVRTDEIELRYGTSRTIARREIVGSVEARANRILVRGIDGGRVLSIDPADRGAEIRSTMRRYGWPVDGPASGG